MPALEGRLGSARVALLTVTQQEFDGVGPLFGLGHNLAGTPYFVAAPAEGRRHPLVLRRLAAQTNTVASEGAGAAIEDFRPEFLILVGTCGGHSGRDRLRLGDVVVAEYIDFSGYWKYKKRATLLRRTPHDHPSGYLLQNFVEPLRVEESSHRRRYRTLRIPGSVVRNVHKKHRVV